MAITPFVRSPNLSSTLVLERMRVKRVIYAKRREALGRGIEDCRQKLVALGARSAGDLEGRLRELEAEDRRVAVFEAELEALVRVEEAAIEHRSGRPRSVTPDPKEAAVAPGGPSRAVSVAAGAAAAIGRYYGMLHLYKAFEAPITGDRAVKPIGDAAEGDPLLDRMISLIDVPGLAHKALLAERGQKVLEISSDEVARGVLGLPAAEAFAEHVFSANAYDVARDEEAAAKFLSDAARSTPKRP